MWVHGFPCELMHREEVEDADDAFLCITPCTNFNHVQSQKLRKLNILPLSGEKNGLDRKF